MRLVGQYRDGVAHAMNTYLKQAINGARGHDRPGGIQVAVNRRSGRRWPTIRKFKHRGVTHWLVNRIVAVIFSWLAWDSRNLGLAFSLGGLWHILTDAMTISGVPVGPWSDRKIYLFGGKLKPGSPTEYLVSAVVVLICAVIAWHKPSTEFVPFFYDWLQYYNEGLIDGKEWKTIVFGFCSLILAMPASAEEAPKNYCHIQSMRDEMDQFLSEAPEDPVVVWLYALRRGLCNMIDRGQIALETGIEVFETEKSKAILERYREEQEVQRKLGA